ncbi:MAG: glycosyltransferase family 39 protein [Acidobacteriia bacterium]|nr:glycosyltransferase family 39 protein [Terriglobia bacterium]
MLKVLTGRFATIALLALTLVLGLYGIERSLWLDEAWVANSVNAPTLGGMFYYPNWLQTSPPLFLLIARAAVKVFGLSTVVLRSVPVVLSLLAVWAMLAAARRAVSPPFAVLATAILAFHPTVVEYFRSFKQYGGEVAASSLVLWAAVTYLKQPQRRQFYILLGVVIAAMTLSYPTVFLLPGLIAAVAVGHRARAITLAGIAGAVLAILYWFLVRPNYTPALRAYWMSDPETLLAPGTIAAVVFCVVAGLRAMSRPWNWIAIILLSPCVLLFASEVMGWYPASPRTQLFVRPCFLLLLAMNLEDLVTFTRWRRAPVDAAVILATAVVMFLGVRKQFHEGRFQPEEDMSGAVRYLRKNVAPSDLVLVHPSLREGFLLYTAIQGWTAKPVIYGDTGWPCCPRGRPAGQDISTPEKIRRDLDARIPRDFQGRIWLFYTNRPLHWEYVRVEDSRLWQNYFWSRNCRPDLYIRFANLGLTPMTCADNSP